jgi:UDP-N-acetylglucosamine acyltransferase
MIFDHIVTEIHPTAIVHPSTQLGADVHIGPYCVIHEGVQLGDGCWLQNHVTVAGPSLIGARNRFYAGASIGQQSQDLKYEGEPTYLEIGADNVFREYVTINRGTAPGSYTRIGSHNHLLAYCHVAHDCTVGNHTIFSNNGTLAGHVTVDDHAVIGGLTAVHQFCRVGRYAITGGCSKIVKDVVPYTITDGNPAEARAINSIKLQRNGFDPAVIKGIEEAYRTIFRKNLTLDAAIEKLQPLAAEHEHVAHMIEFCRSSTRGFCR